MTETVTTKKTARRSPDTGRGPAAAHERLAAQLAEDRDRERRLKSALKDYLAAQERIAAADQACQRKVDAVRTQAALRITQLREDSRAKVAKAHEQLALAALRMHVTGRTVAKVAELLQVSEKKVQELIGTGRQLAEQQPALVPDVNRPAATAAESASAVAAEGADEPRAGRGGAAVVPPPPGAPATETARGGASVALPPEVPGR